MSLGYSQGDLVQNQSEDKNNELGVLIMPEDAHPHFWKVLSANGVESWFEFNLKKLEVVKDET